MRRVSLKEQLVGRSAAAAERLLVRSALNPVLWLCAIVTVPCVALAALSDDPPRWLIVLAYGPVVLVSIGFIFLLIFDRGKLQSEDFQLRTRVLELMMEEKGGLPESTRRALRDVIPNPEVRRLSQRSEDDDDDD